VRGGIGMEFYVSKKTFDYTAQYKLLRYTC
jgi:hypothetical protein